MPAMPIMSGSSSSSAAASRNSGSLRAFFSSMVYRGLLGKARLSYWEFLLTAATRYRRSFGAAMTLAVMGHHFRTITDQLSNADS
jgi:hypothetical protein